MSTCGDECNLKVQCFCVLGFTALLLSFLLYLAGKTVFTYQVYGFTLTLILILAFAEVASIVQVSLEYLVLSEYLQIRDQISTTNPSILDRMYREAYSYVAF